MRIVTNFLFLILSMGLVSCAYTPPRPPGHGTPGPGKIQVAIDGDVKHPGKYWIPESSNLVTVQEVFGGWAGRGDFSAPPKSEIVSRLIDGQPTRTKYTWRLPPSEKAAIILKHGDKLRYPVVVW